jgi:hypothetical protein
LAYLDLVEEEEKGFADVCARAQLMLQIDQKLHKPVQQGKAEVDVVGAEVAEGSVGD